MRKTLVATVLMALVLVPVLATAADYVIGEGDVLNISVWGESDLNTNTRVRPDGKISMPGLGDVVAAGRTPEQLKERLTKDLAKLVKAPIVTVSVEEFLNSQVYVVGGGVESGVHPLLQRTTLLQLLASLGNMEEADLKDAYVFRGNKKILSDFDALFHGGEMDKDIPLEAGDMVYIPLKSERNVFVLGAVEDPKAIFAREGLTVLEAILEAGGFNKFADAKSTFVMRRGESKLERISVDGRALIEKGDMKQNLTLQAGDYVIVQESFF